MKLLAASCLVLIDSGMDFTFFLLLGLPLAALVGYMACELRQHMIALRSFDELRSYHDISIWLVSGRHVCLTSISKYYYFVWLILQGSEAR